MKFKIFTNVTAALFEVMNQSLILKKSGVYTFSNSFCRSHSGKSKGSEGTVLLRCSMTSEGTTSGTEPFKKRGRNRRSRSSSQRAWIVWALNPEQSNRITTKNIIERKRQQERYGELLILKKYIFSHKRIIVTWVSYKAVILFILNKKDRFPLEIGIYLMAYFSSLNFQHI